VSVLMAKAVTAIIYVAYYFFERVRSRQKGKVLNITKAMNNGILMCVEIKQGLVSKKSRVNTDAKKE
jgi:hypothetical protein